LEAVIALAILGIALVPIMAFLENSARQLGVAARTNEQVMARSAALGYIETVNPMATAEGEVELSDRLALRWASEVLIEPGDQAPLGAKLGGYKLGLFRIDVTVLKSEQPWFDFSVRKVGYTVATPSLLPGGPQ
jgi:hypothetical protein